MYGDDWLLGYYCDMTPEQVARSIVYGRKIQIALSFVEGDGPPRGFVSSRRIPVKVEFEHIKTLRTGNGRLETKGWIHWHRKIVDHGLRSYSESVEVTFDFHRQEVICVPHRGV